MTKGGVTQIRTPKKPKIFADFRLSGALVFFRTVADRPAVGSLNSSVTSLILSCSASPSGEASFCEALAGGVLRTHLQPQSSWDNSRVVGVAGDSDVAEFPVPKSGVICAPSRVV